MDLQLKLTRNNCTDDDLGCRDTVASVGESCCVSRSNGQLLKPCVILRCHSLKEVAMDQFQPQHTSIQVRTDILLVDLGPNLFAGMHSL
jgi:hypothetical protein